MRDHQDIAATQRLGIERAGDVRGDREVALRQCRGGGCVRRVRGVRRLHLASDVGADRPGLAVGLVKQDSGDGCGAHDIGA